MDWVNFGLLLYDHIALYLVILAVSVLLYIFLFRSLYLSVLDPLVFALLFSVFGFSVVWFLYFTHSMDTIYLVSYLLTQIAFWAGLFTFKSLRKSSIIREYPSVTFAHQQLFEVVFFTTSSLLYMVLQLLSYRVIGIPLLLGTHIDLYSNSGGWGILGRVLDVIKPCSIFMLIYFLFKKGVTLSMRLYTWFFLIAVVVFFVLSGSKGEFMLLGFLIFCFLLLNGAQLKNQFLRIRRLEVILLLAGLGVAFLTIIVQSTQDDSSLNQFLFRLVASGDTYYFSYPNHNIEHVNGSQPFFALFGDIFSTLRIVPRENQPVILGVQLFRMFSDLDITAGPNARQNVFGYVYFGFWGSIVFSYVIGFTLSLIRNKAFFNLRKNLFGQLAFVFFYLNFSGVETDPPMAISNLENVMLIFPALLFICFFLFILLVKIPQQQGFKSQAGLKISGNG